MTLPEFVQSIPDWDKNAPREKIILFAWFLAEHANKDVFDNAAIRQCFKDVSEVSPDVSVYLPHILNVTPSPIMKVKGGYKLEGATKRMLDKKYGQAPNVVAVSNLLLSLPSQLQHPFQQVFLNEALNCYRVEAYRAATVMTWNLAFDHLLRWILADDARLAKFNLSVAKVYPKKSITVADIDDFEDFKEFEVIEIFGNTALVSKNIIQILKDQLKRRNMAAHPSQVIITQAQADHAITDLVNNVVLALK